MQTITSGNLYEMILKGDPVTVVDVLDEETFRKAHLRGAINIPFGDSFEADVRRRIPDLSEPIVVYCNDSSCPLSADAARQLEGYGYQKVTHYPGGRTEWMEAGLPVEGLGEAAQPT
jgi:rhodanese-related sulfurtransferase